MSIYQSLIHKLLFATQQQVWAANKQGPKWPVDRTIFLIGQPKKAGKVAMSNGSHAKRTPTLCMNK